MNFVQLTIIVCFCNTFMTTHDETLEKAPNAMQMERMIAWFISSGLWIWRISWLSLSQIEKQLKSPGKQKTIFITTKVIAPAQNHN